MANPILKIVQLIFDRKSGAKMEADAKRSLDAVDRAIDRVRKTVLKLATGVGAAFTFRAITAFGREAMRVAAEAEKIWTNLRGTVENVGVAWDTVSEKYEAAARAFQDATVWDDEAFAEGAARIISLTGEEANGIQGMALAANVAARFFKGELAPATELVGRVLAGNTRQLRQLGIITDDANEGLRILAERSLNAATDRAATFGGQLSQVNNAWDDFKQAVGEALIEAGGGASVLQTLTGVIQVMTQWMENNKGVFQTWMTALRNSILIVMAVTDVVRGLAMMLAGPFAGTTAAAARGLALLAKVASLAYVAKAKLLGIFDKNAEARARAEARAWQEQADAYNAQAVAYERLAASMIRGGARLMNRVPTLPGLPPANAPAAPQTVADVLGGLRARNLKTGGEGAETEAQKALNDAKREAEKITQSVMTAEEKYAATVAVLKTHLDAGRISQETYNRALAAAQEELAGAAAKEDEVAAAMTAHGEAVRASLVLAQLLGSGYSAAEAEADSLIRTMQRLADEGIGATDERMQAMAARLEELQGGMRRMQEEAELTGEIASAVGEVIGAAFGRGIPELAAGKAKQNAILAAEETAHGLAALAGLFTAGTAPAHFAAAARYAAIASAWGALAATTGGFSGGGGGGGGARGTPARDVGGERSERAQPAAADVTINLIGDGFDAINPRVQRVVSGTTEAVRERYGNNAKINIYRKGSRVTK